MEKFVGIRRSRLRQLQRFVVPDWVRKGLRDIQYSLTEPKKLSGWTEQRSKVDRLLHFLHIQKTGGTAVANALSKGEPRSRYAITYRGHGSGMRRVPLGDGVIFFVRDPVERFVSGFNDRLARGQPRYDDPWTFNEFLAFQQFRTPDQLAHALSSKKSSERRAAEHAMKTVRHVNSRLNKWLVSEDYLRSRASDIFFVGRQEHLEDDFETLSELLDLPPSCRLPSDPVLAHRRPREQGNELSPASIRNLKEWFVEDYHLISISCSLGLAPRRAEYL